LVPTMAKRDPQHDSGTGTVTKTKPVEKLKRPRTYKVLFHNDD